MKNKLISQPIGIIKTMPEEWIKKLPNGISAWEKTFMKMNDIEDYYWQFNLSGKPKYEVLYFYLLFNKAVRYRCNIISYGKEETIKCYDGTFHYGKVWVQVSAPVIKLKQPISMQGFQGFRYTSEVWG